MVISVDERKHIQDSERVVESATSDWLAGSDGDVEDLEPEGDHLYRNVLVEEAQDVDEIQSLVSS